MDVAPQVYPTTAPDEARPMGSGPFLPPGDVVTWHYRRLGWTPGMPEVVTPVRVVREDERGLVAWLAAGTSHLTLRYADGGGLRSVPLTERWTNEHRRVQAVEEWQGNGILRIAPAGKPWSVWLFWEPGDVQSSDPEEWVFAGWYVNLENSHLRCGSSTFTSDHILDVWIEPDGAIHLKDEDELDAAVEQLRLTPDLAALIRANADAGATAYRSGGWPFAEDLTRWRPDPAWSVPDLPQTAQWQLDLCAR